MYNRYIQQKDGSYTRRAVPDPPQAPSAPPAAPPQAAPPPPAPMPPRPANPGPANPAPGGSVGGFLRNLLPQGFSTEDLIVVLLLLLMAGDDQEAKSNALLTLALYLIL